MQGAPHEPGRRALRNPLIKQVRQWRLREAKLLAHRHTASEEEWHVEPGAHVSYSPGCARWEREERLLITKTGFLMVPGV